MSKKPSYKCDNWLWFLLPPGNITRKLDKAVKKDTVIVPDGGYTIIRFLADNPGWWFFHCHLEFHVEVIELESESQLVKVESRGI